MTCKANSKLLKCLHAGMTDKLKFECEGDIEEVLEAANSAGNSPSSPDVSIGLGFSHPFGPSDCDESAKKPERTSQVSKAKKFLAKAGLGRNKCKELPETVDEFKQVIIIVVYLLT